MPISTKPGPALARPAVVDAIRQAILGGDLVPGQRLVESELCELLGASRGVVRTALIDLDHDRLVERIANRGARVRVVGLQEALQIAEVRLAIETLIVARAAERITDREIRKLRDLTRQLKNRPEPGAVVGYADLVQQIFETYIRIGDQPVAADILRRLRARNTNQRFRLIYRPGRAEIVISYWLELVDAICKRDPVAACEILRLHSQNVQEAMKTLAQERSAFAVSST